MGNENTNAEIHCTENESGDGITCNLNLEENGKKASCSVSFEEESGGKGIGAKIKCSGDKDLMKKLEQRAQNMHIDV